MCVRSIRLDVVVADIHLLGVSFWLGALAPLLLIARHGDARRAAAAAERFRRAGARVVGALALAGLCLLCVLLGSASDCGAAATDATSS